MSDINEIRSALNHIDPHDRDTWWQMGAAVKDELGEAGHDVWDEWSQQADNYDSRTAKATWRSLKTGIWHIESVYKLARQNGWKPDRPYTPPSAEEQAARQAAREAGRQAEEAQRLQNRERVRGLAQSIWANSRPAQADHPYLAAKGITDEASIAGLRRNEYQGSDNLVVPVYSGGEIVNIQSISPDGGKRFLSGGQVQGGYAVVGNAAELSDGIVVAEGYATAASIRQATGKPVIVAFNAGNMVAVAERLSQNLPENVLVIFAVDNDASLTGMKKARQAAAFFGGRAVCVQPEFTMTQIQQYQKGRGADEQGRPPLPSDFNDLHALAGIGAVRNQMDAAVRIHEQEHTMAKEASTAAFNGADFVRELKAELDKDFQAEKQPFDGQGVSQPSAQAADVADSVIEDERRMSGWPSENSPATPKAAEQPEPAEPAPSAAEAEANSIEYASLRPARQPEPYQAVDPEHVYGSGRAPDAQDVPEPDVQDAAAGGAAATESPRTADASESVTPGETAAETAREKQQEIPPDIPSAKKPVLDLGYDIPPASIKSRYVTTESLLGQSQYRRIDNHNTVVFSDWGGSLHTPRTDRQVVEDMLEVAKAKGWDGIRINGGKEFRRMMFLEAESQGIRTSGYRPTKQDLALLETMRQRRAVNSIEAEPQQQEIERPSEKTVPTQPAVAKPASAPSQDIGERIVSIDSAPYKHDPDNEESPYIVLEKNGRERTVWGVDLPDAIERSGAAVGDRIRLHSLGRQPVKITVPVKDAQGNVVGEKEQEAHRNMFKMEIVQNGRGQDKTPEQPHAEQPDAAMIAQAEKLRTRSAVPTDAAINTSPEADTRPGVPLQSIGGHEIPAEANAAADRMKAEALEPRYLSAKTVYTDKADKLTKPNKQRLQWHERNVMDTIRGLKGEARTRALTNYYEQTAKQMSGSKLKLPQAVQIPQQTQQEQNRRQQERSQQQEQSRRQVPEMER